MKKGGKKRKNKLANEMSRHDCKQARLETTPKLPRYVTEGEGGECNPKQTSKNTLLTTQHMQWADG